MPFTEEVWKDSKTGKFYGSHTGHEYAKGDTEEKGLGLWAKPCYAAPGEINIEIGEQKDPGQSIPHGNGAGKKYSY